jgi:S-adenosylmethionine:tRNA ribosyltransferase-isomerase
VRVSDFHFDLPEELIAQHPPAERGASRMLVISREQVPGPGWQDAWFRDLPEFLGAGDLLVLNDSRVLPARLFATRGGLSTQANSPSPSGVVEVLLTEEVEGLVWRALVKPAKKVRVGERLLFHETGQERNAGILPSGQNDKDLEKDQDLRPALSAEVVAAGEFGERTLRFAPVADFYERVGRIGHMPLPPYIRREQAVEADSDEDRERYQTVYSQTVGSAAAPTAGLHFTPEILEALRGRGVEIAYVTLHVGLGTFQPVRVSELKDIRLHAERYTLPAATAEALNRALAEGRRVIAVGTTTTRTLEHIAAELEKANHRDHVEGEWRPRFEAHSGSTSIFIGPGHRFRVVSGLLTNFHLPESTLLMLVSAFAGREKVLAAYAHAIREGYRFYSYGDCMFVV